MNETGTWATPLIFLVWLWCFVAFLLSFFARGRRAAHVSGVVGLVAFAVFWGSLIENDSDPVAWPVLAGAVAAIVLWWLRRYWLVALVFWAACLLLLATGYGFMAFFGPAPIAVVATMMALLTRDPAVQT